MRIIAGSARSLKLKTVEGFNTRPTTDKIKETLFNILQGEIFGTYFLDLFSGSGQIGLEALSRGANYCVFIENNKKAFGCVTDNIKSTKFEHSSFAMNMDVISGLRSLEGKYKFDIVFMDPPYNKGLEKEVLEYLKESSLLKEDTIIIIETDLNTNYDYVSQLGFELYKYKKYKTNAHVFLRIIGG